MASLPHHVLWSLVDACVRARIGRELLLAPISPLVAASVQTGDTVLTQIFHVWCHLNSMSWPADQEHPMCQALTAAANIARGSGLADVFRVALSHFGEPATFDSWSERVLHALFTRKTKESYLSSGCRVTPGLDDPPTPFLVEHPDRRTSIVAVFLDGGGAGPLLAALLASVRQTIASIRSAGEDVDGYVVLAPTGRRADRQQVLEAGFRALDYREQVNEGFDRMETAVRCLLGADPEPIEEGFSVVHAGDARTVEEGLTAFLGDPEARVWLLVQPRDAEPALFQRALFRVAAHSFLRRGPPAPLPLGIIWRGRRLAACASELVGAQGVQLSMLALDRFLREGAVVPLLVQEAKDPASAGIDARALSSLIESMSEKSKVVMVLPPDRGGLVQQLRGSLGKAGYPARMVAALSNQA